MGGQPAVRDRVADAELGARAEPLEPVSCGAISACAPQFSTTDDRPSSASASCRGMLNWLAAVVSRWVTSTHSAPSGSP